MQNIPLHLINVTILSQLVHCESIRHTNEQYLRIKRNLFFGAVIMDFHEFRCHCAILSLFVISSAFDSTWHSSQLKKSPT